MFWMFFIVNLLIFEDNIFLDICNDVIVVEVCVKVFFEIDRYDVGFFLEKGKVDFIYGYIIFWFEFCVVVMVIDLVDIISE